MSPLIDFSTQPANTGKPREQTLRLVISGLAARPAYLIIFGLGLVSTTIVGMAVLLSDKDSVVAMAFGSWFIYCVLSLAVISKLESAQTKSLEFIPDQTAKKEFMAGVDASFLAGEWESLWTSADEPEKKERIELSITTDGCLVMVCAFPEGTGKTFWMWGRLSEGNVLSLVAWGKFKGGNAGLAGADFMTLDAGTDCLSMSGHWMGRGKMGAFVSGSVFWKKLSE
jgi:hypothetical protein